LIKNIIEDPVEHEMMKVKGISWWKT